MAKFVYKMQNILNIKMRLESQAKTEYAEVAARLAMEEDRMKELLLRRRQYENEAKQNAMERLNIPEMKRCNNSIETMKELIKQQAVRVRIAQKNLEQARAKLNLAMQERKIHEKLREKAFDEFKLELNAQEKKEIDEVVSFNYNDNKMETGE